MAVEPKSWKEYLATRPPAELPLRSTDLLAVLTGAIVCQLSWNDLLAEMRRLAETPRIVAESGAVLAADRMIVIDASAGAVDLTFLSAAHADAKVIKVMRSRSDPGDNVVRLLPSPGQTLSGEEEITLAPGEGFEYIPDGAADYLQF